MHCLQLANFWQDVARDYKDLGRVYLPEQDRRQFGYGDEDLKARRFTPQFRELLRFEVNRTRDMFEKGRPLLPLIPSDVRVDIELFLEGGLAILRGIEAIDYDVWSKRPEVSRREKLGLLLRAIRRKSLRFSVCAGLADPSHTPHAPREDNPHAEREEYTGLQTSYRWCRHLTRRTAQLWVFVSRLTQSQTSCDGCALRFHAHHR